MDSKRRINIGKNTNHNEIGGRNIYERQWLIDALALLIRTFASTWEYWHCGARTRRESDRDRVRPWWSDRSKGAAEPSPFKDRFEFRSSLLFFNWLSRQIFSSRLLDLCVVLLILILSFMAVTHDGPQPISHRSTAGRGTSPYGKAILPWLLSRSALLFAESTAVASTPSSPRPGWWSSLRHAEASCRRGLPGAGERMRRRSGEARRGSHGGGCWWRCTVRLASWGGDCWRACHPSRRGIGRTYCSWASLLPCTSTSPRRLCVLIVHGCPWSITLDICVVSFAFCVHTYCVCTYICCRSFPYNK